MIFGRNPINRCAAILLGTWLSFNALAAEPLTLEGLMKSLSEVKQAQVEFNEVKKLAVLTAPLRTSGKLVYRAPAFLEKETLQPYREVLRIDGNNIIRETQRGQKQSFSLQAYPAVWAFVESFRATLAGDLKTLEKFYKVRLDGNQKQWQLLLLPKDPDMGELVHAIRIHGRGHQITSIETQEASGDSSIMTLSRLK